MLKKNENFEWTRMFSNFKEFLASPPILTRPVDDLPLYIDLSITGQMMSSIFVQETNKMDRIFYSISNMFKDVEAQY